MARFMLISGAWHAAWCWEKLAPLLEARGHHVAAPDLTGMARGQPQFAERMTIAAWADQIAELLRDSPEQVMLVGHSRGGLVISEAAERVPEKIRQLVYLSAFLLPNGASIGRTAATIDRGVTPDKLEPGSAEGFLVVKRGLAVPTFYHRCDAQDAAASVDRLVPEPVTSFTTPARLTDANFGSRKRGYIECSDDHAVPLDLQRAMQQTLPCDPVVTLESDHSPFYSAPEALADALGTMAEA
ncbi:alpha/beta fold hydrolase [Novosphingopyxis sp.]|uniref:alpha/beta fold hydrolase n=1 Tax=Novosphingopyxis sp. TaxID=2709690 RepID=UPI003B5A8C70